MITHLILTRFNVRIFHGEHFAGEQVEWLTPRLRWLEEICAPLASPSDQPKLSLVGALRPRNTN
jgi:hypothetical protein